MATLRMAIDARGMKRGAADAKKATDSVQKGTKEASEGVEKLDKKMEQVSTSGDKMQKTLKRAFAALGGLLIIRDATQTISGFQQALATLQGITRATGPDLEALEEVARNLGATTSFSAKEAAEGLIFLARAGFSIEEQITALPPVLNLAIAAQLGLGEAADIASNTLSQFRLEISQTEEVTDILVGTANRANTDVRGMAEALKYAGPFAAGLGIELRDVAAAIGVLGDNAIQGSQAGTALRAMMARLLRPVGEAKEAMKELDLNTKNFDITTLGLIGSLEVLAQKGATPKQLAALFGQEAVSAAIAATASIERLKELRGEIQNVEGETEDFAKIQANTLGGAFKSLRSSIEEAFLQVGDAGFAGGLKSVVRAGAGAIQILTGMADETTRADTSAQLMAGTLRLVAITLTAIVAVKIVLFFISLTSAIVAAKAQLIALGAVMRAHPILAIASVLAIAGAALFSFSDTTADATVEASGFNVELEQMKSNLENLEKTKVSLARALELGETGRALTAVRSQIETLVAESERLRAKPVGFFASQLQGSFGENVPISEQTQVAALVKLLEQVGLTADESQLKILELTRSSGGDFFGGRAADKVGFQFIQVSDVVKVIEERIAALTKRADELKGKLVDKTVADEDARAKREAAEQRVELEKLVKALQEEQELIGKSARERDLILAKRKAEAVVSKLEVEQRKEALALIERLVQRTNDLQEAEARRDPLKDLSQLVKSLEDETDLLERAKQGTIDLAHEREVLNAQAKAKQILDKAGIENQGAFLKFVEEETREQIRLREAIDKVNEDKRKAEGIREKETQQVKEATKAIQAMKDELALESQLVGKTSDEQELVTKTRQLESLAIKAQEKDIASLVESYSRELTVLQKRRQEASDRAREVQEIKDANKALKDMQDELRFESQLLGKTADEREFAIRMREFESVAIRSQRGDIGELLQSYGQELTAMQNRRKQLENMAESVGEAVERAFSKEELTRTADDIGNAFGDVLGEIQVGFGDVEAAAESLVTNVQKLLYRQLVQQPISNLISNLTQQLFSALGVGIGAGSSTSGAANSVVANAAQVPSAMGNVFTTRYFAFGGLPDIIDRPTRFPIRGGIGQAGESGTEAAIAPLFRDGSGRLGVMVGGGGNSTSQHFHFHGVKDIDSFRRNKRQMADFVRRNMGGQ